MERRRQSRKNTPVSTEVSIVIERSGGERLRKKAALADVSEWGLGLQTSAPMVVGARLLVWGPALPNAPSEDNARAARVMHCRLDGELYRAGCAFEDSPRAASAEPPKGDASLTDYYEILQLSPSADVDTVHRVYRVLAQRYHPDNPETGDIVAFQNVLQAYETLSNPERRAAYDAKYQASRALRWRIFRKPEELTGIDGERRIRNAILQALYAKLRNDPQSPGMMARELEQLLGCPSEHLRFPLWYVTKKKWVVGGDNGRYIITIEGVDHAEETLERDGAPAGPTSDVMELPEAKAR